MVAIPSRWAEAFSIAALEAMSVGRPVVASRVGGVPELFVGRTPGTLYEQGNVKELATILDGYANDSDKLREDGRTALDLYWSTYTPQHMASRVTATYRELIV